MNEDALQPHVEQTVRAVEQLHAEHHDSANWSDRFLERLRAQVSRPGFIVVLFVLAVTWVSINRVWKSSAVDPPPFMYLQLLLSFGAVCLTILILATQRRADRLAGHREKLILQLGFASEQKTAKIIALVEELRRDTPHVKDRADPEAEQMTETVNVRAVSDALRDEGAGHPASEGR